MENSKVGQLNFGKFKTEVLATKEVKDKFKTIKSSLAVLVPAAWVFYDVELLDAIDENGDGKPDEKFGTNFKIIYFLEKENILEFEKDFLTMSKVTIKDVRLKYVVLKN